MSTSEQGAREIIATRGIMCESLVSGRTGEPRVNVVLDRAVAGAASASLCVQMSVDEARDLAMNLLQCAEANAESATDAQMADMMEMRATRAELEVDRLSSELAELKRREAYQRARAEALRSAIALNRQLGPREGCPWCEREGTCEVHAAWEMPAEMPEGWGDVG